MGYALKKGRLCTHACIPSRLRQVFIYLYLRLITSYLARTLDMDATFTELLGIAKQISAGIVPQYQHSETFTVGAFDLVLTKLRGGDAFALLLHACRNYPSVKSDAALLRGYLFMITDLAHQTNTTELPDGIDAIVNDNPDQTIGLQEWYRISPSTT